MDVGLEIGNVTPWGLIFGILVKYWDSAKQRRYHFLGYRWGPDPTQQQLDNMYTMVKYSPYYYPYYRLLLGGGRTQSETLNPT